MDKKTVDKLLLGMMALPVVVFVVMALVMGLPEKSLFSVKEFYLQTGVTLVTILSVPTLLWFVRKDRMKDPDFMLPNGLTRYQGILLIRMFLLLFLCLLHVILYFGVPNVSFFYLAVIVYLSMFFARQ